MAATKYLEGGGEAKDRGRRSSHLKQGKNTGNETRRTLMFGKNKIREVKWRSSTAYE